MAALNRQGQGQGQRQRCRQRRAPFLAGSCVLLLAWLLFSLFGEIEDAQLLAFSTSSLFLLQNSVLSTMTAIDLDKNSKNQTRTSSTTCNDNDNENGNRNNKSKEPKILVAFTGPGDMKQAKRPRDPELYERNLEYFLKHGLGSCRDRDTIITVGHNYYHRYLEQVRAIALELQCNKHGHFIYLVSRRSACYDMETVRLLAHGSIAGVVWEDYDYFLYVNCGVTGPHFKFRDTWVPIYLDKLQPHDPNGVHMTGLTLHCEGPYTHIQSMMYAVDRIGMQIVQKRTFDCLLDDDKDKSFIGFYERGMGQHLLQQGHALAAATLQNGTVVTAQNVSVCNYTKDFWITKHMKSQHFFNNSNHMPILEETIFWKSSRIMTPEIKELIGYTGKLYTW